MKKKNTSNYPKSAAMGIFSKGLKNEFETAVVNEPSVFEPLKFFCIMKKSLDHETKLMAQYASPPSIDLLQMFVLASLKILSLMAT